MNDQRKVIFEQRIDLMKTEDVSDTINDMRHEVISDIVERHIPKNAYADQWDVDGLDEEVKSGLALGLPIREWAEEEGIDEEAITDRITGIADEHAAEKAERFGPEVIRYVQKSVLLQTIDHLWREHLVNLDHLRSVIGFRGYGQRDPLQEYKGESFELFQAMLANLRQAVTSQMARVELVQEDPMAQAKQAAAKMLADGEGSDEFDASEYGDEELDFSNLPEGWQNTRRNDPCPCGSGKKFKHCHGKYV